MDRCPECESTHIDMWDAAREAIGYPRNGPNPQVTWDFVDCSQASGGSGGSGNGDFSQSSSTTGSTDGSNFGGSSSPFGSLTLKVKDGVSQYWFAALVPGASAMTAKKSDGSWGEMEHQSYNYFTLDVGTGTSSTDVKATVGGKEIMFSNVPCQGGATVQQS